jgi:hypothetical protein
MIYGGNIKMLSARRSNSNPGTLSVCLAFLLASSVGHAQIYKWVDANGQTHYSERKEDADKAKAAELKVNSGALSKEVSNASLRYWQEQDRQFKQRQAQKQLAERSSIPPVATQPKSLSGGRADGTDASRCNLARDVLSGAVRLRNGLPTGAVERKIAEDDVRLACH